MGYRDIQDRLLLKRSFAEVEVQRRYHRHSERNPDDGPLRVPSLAANGEAEIYLGIFAPCWFWRRSSGGDATSRTRVVAPAANDHRRQGAIYTLIAVGIVRLWSVSLGPLKVSASQMVQPLSIAIFCVFLLGITSAAYVDTFCRKSIFAFYVTAGRADMDVHAQSTATAPRKPVDLPWSI